MATPTIERPRVTPPPTRRRLLPQTRIGWWALGLQLLAVGLAVCWPPLGRALGNSAMGLAIVAAGAVIGTGSVAIFRAKERSVLLITLFTITTTALVLVGLLMLGMALWPPDMNPGP